MNTTVQVGCLVVLHSILVLFVLWELSTRLYVRFYIYIYRTGSVCWCGSCTRRKRTANTVYTIAIMLFCQSQNSGIRPRTFPCGESCVFEHEVVSHAMTAEKPPTRWSVVDETYVWIVPHTVRALSNSLQWKCCCLLMLMLLWRRNWTCILGMQHLLLPLTLLCFTRLLLPPSWWQSSQHMSHYLRTYLRIHWVRDIGWPELTAQRLGIYLVRVCLEL